MTTWNDDLKDTEARLEKKTQGFEDKIKEFEEEKKEFKENKDKFEVTVSACAWHQHAHARATAHAHSKMLNLQKNAAKHPELFDDDREKEREELDKQWDNFFKEKKEAREKAIKEQREKLEKEFLEKEQKQFETEKDRWGICVWIPQRFFPASNSSRPCHKSSYLPLPMCWPA